jgi:hypothetical protein
MDVAASTANVNEPNSASGPSAGGARRKKVSALVMLEDATDAFCRLADPARLSGPLAAEACERVSLVIRKLTAVQARLAGRVDDTSGWMGRGHSSGPSWLAAATGGSMADAYRMLHTVKRLDDCPHTAEAFDEGTLSLGEADLVSKGAKADPLAERELVDGAKGHDFKRTRTRV